MRFAKGRFAGARSGVILLEVMLATAIFCMAGVALARAMGVALDAARRTDRRTEARLGLESRLAEARSLPRETGPHRTKPGPDGIAYEWEWKPLALHNRDGEALPGLYELTARARWMEDGAPEEDAATIRVYRPLP